jgi:hypothetical protein
MTARRAKGDARRITDMYMTEGDNLDCNESHTVEWIKDWPSI